MSGARSRPVFASDDWMFEQQMRAEMEAEAWRRLRAESPSAAPAPVAPAVPQIEAPARDPHRTGSAMLKGLVRFALAAFAAYLAWITAIDSRLGEFEIWLAIGASFTATLALSVLAPMRGFVHLLAEAARWAIIVAVALGAVWVFVQMAS